MEIKKSPKADLENKRLIYLLLGYVFILAVLFVGFEWTNRDVKKANMDGVSDVFVEEEIIPITERMETPPPPPPPAPEVVVEEINVVENEKEVADVQIESTEDTKDKKVEIVFQKPVIEEEDPTEHQIFTVVEEMPQFPGGETALLQYLAKSVKYPVIAQENGIQGRVICSFTINKDGKVVDPVVVRGVDPSLDKEAIRVINAMPAWKPGKQRGKPVRVKYTVPINFRLQ
ncbi:MAG: energy transducer TonB [Bacteroidales bacterium]